MLAKTIGAYRAAGITLNFKLLVYYFKKAGTSFSSE
jgi:hypothetical protein